MSQCIAAKSAIYQRRKEYATSGKKHHPSIQKSEETARVKPTCSRNCVPRTSAGGLPVPTDRVQPKQEEVQAIGAQLTTSCEVRNSHTDFPTVECFNYKHSKRHARLRRRTFSALLPKNRNCASLPTAESYLDKQVRLSGVDFPNMGCAGGSSELRAAQRAFRVTHKCHVANARMPRVF